MGADAAYRPLAASTGHVVAFARGEQPTVVTVATRLGRTVAQLGAAEHTVVLPEGTWEDIRSGSTYDGGPVAVSELLAACPVAVLEKAEDR